MTNISAKRLELYLNRLQQFHHPRIRFYVNRNKERPFRWKITCEFEQHRGFAQTVVSVYLHTFGRTSKSRYKESQDVFRISFLRTQIIRKQLAERVKGRGFIQLTTNTTWVVMETLPKKPKIDYASVDRPFPDGPNHYDLALVCPFLAPQPFSLTSDLFSVTHESPNPTSAVNSKITIASVRLHIFTSWQLTRIL